jgi:membrane fusion protein, copper/silver efflux system
MRNFILGFLAAAALLTGGYFAYTHRGTLISMKTAPKRLYHCPMHPTYISDKPGDCPICGMKLVPIEPASSGQHAGHETGASAGQQAMAESMVPGYAPVAIPAERIQSMGIMLAEASRLSLDQSFRTYGRVTYDETRIHHVHTRFEGYIEDLFVNYTGQFVTKGQPLFSVYSPELYATQNEYLLALRAKEQSRQSKESSGIGGESSIDLVAAARERLALWNIGDQEIRDLERTRKPSRALTIFSPASGYVTSKTAVHGLKVTPADNLYDIVDLSVVWVLADIYEVNLPFVQTGQPAAMDLDYRPGKTWRGKVVFIDPTLDASTRTVKARLEFANPNNELKPEMYAHVVIGGSRATGIAVPESAVIATGERDIVFVAKGDGVFEPREVVLGVHVRNMYEIKQGVSEGEKVVTGANFLLDSESKLKAAVSSGSENGAAKTGTVTTIPK